MKRWISSLLIIFLAAMALLLQGCDKSLSQTPEPVEINFVFPLEDQAFYTPLIEAYQEQHPGHLVITKPLADEVNKEGDVEVIRWFGESAMATAHLPLDEMIREEVSLNLGDWYPGALDAFKEDKDVKEDEKIYAVPYGLDPFVLFYNQELIERLDLPAPQPGWNWGDFLALAQAMTLPDEGIYGYANAYGESMDATLFIYSRGGRLFDQDGRPTLNEPETISALDWFGRLYTDYEVAFPHGKDVYPAFEAGKVGMWLAPFMMRTPEWLEMSGMKYSVGVSLLPAGEGQPTLVMFEGYAISTKAKYPDACWTFIRFLLDHPNPRLVPARRSLAESQAYRDLVGEQAASVGLEAVSGALQLSQSMMMDLMQVSLPFKQAVEQVISGQKTAEAALEEAQRQAEGEP